FDVGSRDARRGRPGGRAGAGGAPAGNHCGATGRAQLPLAGPGCQRPQRAELCFCGLPAGRQRAANRPHQGPGAGFTPAAANAARHRNALPQRGLVGFLLERPAPGHLAERQLWPDAGPGLDAHAPGIAMATAAPRLAQRHPSGVFLARSVIMTPNNNTQSTHRLGAPGERARTLARLGLLPLVLGTLLLWLLADHVEPEPYAFVVQSVASYAALVVAFLAGMPWGLAALRSVHEGPKRPEGIGEDKATLRWSVALISAAWMALLMP